MGGGGDRQQYLLSTWLPDDAERAHATRAGLRQYFRKEATLVFVQLLPKPDFDPEGWLLGMIERVGAVDDA